MHYGMHCYYEVSQKRIKKWESVVEAPLMIADIGRRKSLIQEVPQQVEIRGNLAALALTVLVLCIYTTPKIFSGCFIITIHFVDSKDDEVGHFTCANGDYIKNGRCKHNNTQLLALVTQYFQCYILFHVKIGWIKK